MSDHDHDFTIGKAPLIGAGALIVACLAGVGAVQAGWISTPAPVVSTAVAAPAISRQVRFEDRADGAVVVRAVDGGRDVIIPADSGGFLRGVARTLTRDRKMRSIGPEAPFLMAEGADGALSLTDTATGRTLKLDAFGPDNRRAFRDLLHGGMD